jgi:hypothetical protein
MSCPRLTWIALALCVACARPNDRGAPPAGDTAKGYWDVGQAGDTTRDTTDGDDGRWDGCIGQADTIEVSGPTIIASSGITVVSRDTEPAVVPRDSAARDSVAAEESDADSGDNSFLLAALPACRPLHSGGIRMYLNGDTTRMMLRRGVVSRISFVEDGFVFVDTSGVRHREEGSLGKYRILELSDSLFGTHLSRGLEP